MLTILLGKVGVQPVPDGPIVTIHIKSPLEYSVLMPAHRASPLRCRP